MNEQNTKYLIDNFNFFQPKKPLTESLMAFGFECGDGWFPLIKELCEKLSALKLKVFEVVQVKEKFGGLRFYPGGIELEKAEAVFKLIDEAEAISFTICEACGAPGKPNQQGWISTLCDPCRQKK
ncbi:hypothetical protein HYT01_03215 [Candidatus Giovannonibacteria bacterium]|nr:hypothetical protein [Candidatus Giovannonibacteria bacterium]